MEVQQFAKQSGFISLVSVLLISVVGAAIAVSVIQLGLGASRLGFSIDQSSQARALADACTEEALQQIRTLTSYTGNGNLSIGQGSCTYTVGTTGGESRIVTATGTVGTVVRKTSLTINKINPAISITSWQEVF